MIVRFMVTAFFTGGRGHRSRTRSRGTVMMITHGQVNPVALAASAVRHAGRSSPVLGQVVLVAVVVAAVGAFAVLQVLARSGRRSPVTGDRRLRGMQPRRTQPWRTQDWRTLPPKDESDPQAGTMSDADQEDYGPLWRYGVPLGYGRVYEPGDRRPS
jgi:hypothetical protein